MYDLASAICRIMSEAYIFMYDLASPIAGKGLKVLFIDPATKKKTSIKA